MKMMNKEEEFLPYKIYLKNTKQINEFEELTDISFGLSQQLLFKHDKNDLPKIDYSNDKDILNKISYSMGDLKVTNTKEKCKWVTIFDYAELASTTIEEINKLLANSELGTTSINPETKEVLIIWPQTYKNKSFDELPEPGKKKFSVTLEINAVNDFEEDIEDMTNFESIQKKFLALAHSIGNPEEVNKNAKNILYRSCFILQWTCFEVFLRNVVDDVVKQNPELLFDDKQSEKLSVTYKELFNYSKKFQDIESLQSKIIENEIAKQEGDNKSVHGIINFLKAKLKFKKDPYSGWYKLKGEHMLTCYNDLIELKDVRNSLMHDAGFANSSFFIDYPNVTNNNGEIIINSDYYLKSKLILRSIAFNIASLIVKKEYKTNNC